MMHYYSYDGKRYESIATSAILLYRCHHDGKCYEFTMSAEQQGGCPKWDTEKDADPPLPAAKALAKAKEFIATVKTTDHLSWELEELALVKIDGWMWQARYCLTKKGLMSGVWPRMPCWILMDGTIIQPRITEDKK